MKKTVISLVVLATTGVVSAQSSVTLYGRIDASIARQKTTNAGNVAGATIDAGTLVRAGAHTGNRWGLRGSEDLGGGLKANFVLEQGFNVDDGTAVNAARQFHRQSWVGLSGGFGAVQVGRVYTTIDTMYTAHDALAASGYSAMSYAFNQGAYANITRQNNAVYYQTPTFGGFKGGVLWAPGENKTAAAGAGRLFGLEAAYTRDALSVGGAWESSKATGATPALTAWELGATYDFGMVKLFGQVEGAKNKATNSKDDGYQIGVTVPLGGPSIAVSYARENNELAGSKVSTASAFALMAQYPLSKRTYAYAAYLNGEIDPVAAGAVTQKNRNFGLGLVHNF